ncbi:MAG: hypothetical protein AUJ12_05650 [Alphaproteobacteria bacterium CG1_02_46_17]|nr:MAG: hypothetical protein AUJ12_05650 [Alphaproteobacteria bacterium CG1_02_46_17]
MILRSMRNGFFSAIFLGLLVIGGFSLVLTDWNGMFRGGGNTKTDVATVNGSPIKISEFNNIAERILRNQNIELNKAYEMGAIDNILQSEILARILALAAKDFGIQVEDKIVAKQVQSLVSPLITEQTNAKQALQQFLQMQGLTEKTLVTMLRGEIETELLKTTIASANYVPQTLEQDISAFKGTTRDLKFVELKNSDIKLDKDADDKMLEDYYEGIKTQYMIPEKRNVTIAILDVSSILKDTKLSDEEIKDFYDAHQEDFQVEEKRILDQAIITNEADAQTILEQAQKSGDLETAVKDVTGNVKAFARDISFAQKDLDGEMATQIFEAKKGAIIGPLKSALGYHVIKIADITPEHIKPLAELKDQISQQLTEEKSGDEIYKLTSEFEDLLAAGEDYAALKGEYNLQIIPVENLKSSDKDFQTDAKLDENQKANILNKTFQMNEGEPSSLLDLTATSFYSTKVDRVTPATPKPFDQIKSLIAKRWKDENQARQNLIKAQDLTEALNAGTTTIEKTGYKIQTINALSRDALQKKVELPASIKDARIIGRFMDAKEGKYIMSIPMDANSILVGATSNTKLGKSDAGLQEQQAKALKSDLSTSNLMLFISNLEKKYPVEINNDLLQRVYGKTQEQE